MKRHCESNKPRRRRNYNALSSSGPGRAIVLLSTIISLSCSGSGVARGGQLPSPEHVSPSVQAPQAILNRGGNDKADALIQRAVHEYRGGDLKRARATVLEARRLDPHRVVTYQIEAQIAYDLGDRSGYLIALRAILSANPQSAKLHNAVGKLLIQAGDVDQGLKAQRRAVKLDPKTVRYAKDLAAAHAVQGRSDLGAQILVSAMKLNPQDKTLSIALARLHEASQNWNEAVQYYELASRRDPKNGLWKKRYAHCLYQSRSYERACAVFAECVDLEDSTEKLAERVEYADCCLRTGRLEIAQKILDRISQDHPGQSKDVELLRGMCAYKRGDISGTKRIIGTALSQWPGDRLLSTINGLCRLAQEELTPPKTAVSAVGQ